jgi:nucleoside-diphosphate-sugar epimerase
VAKTRYGLAQVARRAAVEFFELDLLDRNTLAALGTRLLDGGGVDFVLHLAGYYDFFSEEHPEYWRSNVVGLRNLLEECRRLEPRLVLFASSVAACSFPPAGGALTERSPPDGEHLYAITKRLGEDMLELYRDSFASTILRLAAVYSDWCQYPPLFSRLEKWASRDWDRRLLGGRGEFAIPYLHIEDLAAFLRAVLEKSHDISPGQVLIASPDAPTSMRDLFAATTRFETGRAENFLYWPKRLCGPGLVVRDALGRITGQRPFERPWMARYIDRQMTVDASLTRRLLGWAPQDRLTLPRRLPTLLENRRRDPREWKLRNGAA